MSQVNLKERLGSQPVRAQLIADCATLIDDQVKAKSGLSGVAIKGAYTTIKTIKKGFIPEVIDSLLDDWLENLQPHYNTWSSGQSGTFSTFVSARSEDVADDLLKVTDARAERTSHTTAKKAYQKMRSSAKKHVAEAVPALGKVVEKHLKPAG